MPHTEVERWLSVFFVFFTATICAWLAGVIVELVSRAGETTRDVDGIFDGLVNYMESINLPKKNGSSFSDFSGMPNPTFECSRSKRRKDLACSKSYLPNEREKKISKARR